MPCTYTGSHETCQPLVVESWAVCREECFRSHSILTCSSASFVLSKLARGDSLFGTRDVVCKDLLAATTCFS